MFIHLIAGLTVMLGSLLAGGPPADVNPNAQNCCELRLECCALDMECCYSAPQKACCATASDCCAQAKACCDAKR